jgi:hypothetical protein
MTDPILSEGQRKAVAAYLRQVADQLGLRDWSISVEPDHPNEADHAAAMWSDYGSRRMKVWCRADLIDLKPDEQRATLIHELVHAHLEGLDWYLEKTLPDLLGRPAWAGVKQAIQQHSEHAVEAIAVSIAPHFPLIEWPEAPAADDPPLT